MNQAVERIVLKNKEIYLIGTAHISQESVHEVETAIEAENPNHVCVEIDAARFRTMTEKKTWESLDIIKVLKEGKGFLLLANLILSSFQKRMGSQIGIKPGEEMLAAVKCAQEKNIPYHFCDREVSLTLKRTWAMSNFWNKSKLLASLIGSAFSNEKLSEEEIENLKNRSELDGMMDELAAYLPSVKQVLIDERDRYLASKIYSSGEGKIVAVIGAGHLKGTIEYINKLDAEIVSADVSDIETLPLPKGIGKFSGWILPIIIVGLILSGFFLAGRDFGLQQIIQWVLWNGSLAALGTLLALGHPLSILISFLGAPIATMNPLIGVGLFAAFVEAFFRKPQVQDFETLSQDVMSLKGIYKNRVSRVLLVFFLSSLGGAIGNWIAIPGMLAKIFSVF